MDVFEEEAGEIEKLKNYSFVIGIVSEKDRPRKKGEKINNAELLFLHEFGSKVKNIPARPVLDIIIKDSQALLDECLNECINLILGGKTQNEYRPVLKKYANAIANMLDKKVRNDKLNLKRLKRATIKRKKSSIPLLDTGQMLRSIVCLVKYNNDYI